MAYVAESLRSLNDRLKALLVVLCGDVEAGQDMPELGVRYLHDLQILEWRKRNDVDEDEESSRDEEDDEGC